MSSANAILSSVYSSFNARDIDSVLVYMHPNVDWPNGMEGGRVHGHDAVRDYWTRQWKQVDPHVEPQRFTPDEKGRIVVDVHQVIRDMAGNVLMDRMVQHVYEIREDLISRMEIIESKV
jgi:hypothetical protein